MKIFLKEKVGSHNLRFLEIAAHFHPNYKHLLNEQRYHDYLRIQCKIANPSKRIKRLLPKHLLATSSSCFGKDEYSL